MLLASWMLIALEHRHPAGPLLLAAGAMEVLAFLALIPDALAGVGWLGPRAAPPELHAARGGHHLTLVDEDAPARPPFGSHLSRRHS